MGCWILHDGEAQRAVFYDSTSEQALGIVSFIGAEAGDQAQSFLAYLHTKHHEAAYPPAGSRVGDPFSYTGADLEDAHKRWYRLVGLENGAGRMNEYGWTLQEWHLLQPTYGAQSDPLNAAPEPEEMAAIDPDEVQL